MSDIQRIEFNGSRFYKRSDEPESCYRPSVTSILSYWVPPALKNWFIKNTAKAIEKKKTETASKGSADHAEYEKQGKEGVKEESRLGRILGKHGLTIVKNEFLVASDLFGYGGQVDASATSLDGKETIIDWKTGRSVGKSAAMQLGAYRYAYFENAGVLANMAVFHMPATDPDGSRDKAIMYKEPFFWMDAFIGLLPAFRAENYWDLKNINWKWLETDFLGEWIKIRTKLGENNGTHS